VLRSRIGLITACLAVVAMLIAPTASAGPRTDPAWPSNAGMRGCPAPVWPQSLNTTVGPGEGRRVLVIGDSLTRIGREPLTNELREAGWTPTIRCWGGKRLDWAMAQVDRAKKLNQLPGVVVIAIGTNDMRWISRDRTKARMQQLIKKIGPKRQVFWVDTHARGGDRFTRDKERWFNGQVKALAKKHDNVHHIEWGDYAREQRVRFVDALHFGRAGARTWAKRIIDQVNSVAGNPQYVLRGPAR
jgi:lysophospholipase L1-like esterase